MKNWRMYPLLALSLIPLFFQGCGDPKDNEFFCGKQAADEEGNKPEACSGAGGDRPTASAAKVEFKDEDPAKGKVTGTIQITKALNESNITHYVVYLGTDDKPKTTKITSIEASGTNVSYKITGQAITSPASFFVFTKNADGEMDTGISTAIDDVESGSSGTTTPSVATDTTAPTVASTIPSSDAKDIGITSSITATFNEAMNDSTINVNTFTLAAGAPVTGTVTYVGTTATFKPSSNLTVNTKYTATITTGAKDSAGNTLAQNHTWTFTTAAQ